MFVIICGFLLASLKIASDMGAMGSSFAVNRASKFAFGTITRGTNIIAGGGANRLRAVQQKYNVGGKFGEIVVNRALRPLESANLDLRRLPGASKTLGFAGIKEGAKPAQKASFNDIRDQVNEVMARKKSKELEAQYESEVAKVKLENELANLQPGQTLSAESQKYLSSMSVKELEELKGIKTGVVALADNLAPEKFEALMKSDKLSDIEKGKLSTARYADLNAAATTGPAAGRVTAIKAITKNMSKKDMEGVPAAILRSPEFLESLSDKQRDDLAGSDKRSAEERSLVRDSSPAANLEKIFSGVPATPTTPAVAPNIAQASLLVQGLTAPQVAKLNVNILRDAAIAQKLTPAMLIELQESKKLRAADISLIAAHITAGGVAASQAFVNPGPPPGPGAVYWS